MPQSMLVSANLPMVNETGQFHFLMVRINRIACQCLHMCGQRDCLGRKGGAGDMGRQNSSDAGVTGFQSVTVSGAARRKLNFPKSPGGRDPSPERQGSAERVEANRKRPRLSHHSPATRGPLHCGSDIDGLHHDIRCCSGLSTDRRVLS